MKSQRESLKIKHKTNITYVTAVFRGFHGFSVHPEHLVRNCAIAARTLRRGPLTRAGGPGDDQRLIWRRLYLIETPADLRFFGAGALPLPGLLGDASPKHFLICMLTRLSCVLILKSADASPSHSGSWVCGRSLNDSPALKPKSYKCRTKDLKKWLLKPLFSLKDFVHKALNSFLNSLHF